MIGIYPEVGLIGTFVTLAPYNAHVPDNIRYTCLAVKSLAGMESQGELPYDTVYAPYGISSLQFRRDLENDVKVITLQSSDGDIIQIPNSFIEKIPDSNGVAYTMMMLCCALQAIPESTELELIKQEISDLVTARIGVGSDVKEVVYGPSVMLSHEMHHAITTHRRDTIDRSDNPILRVGKLEKENHDLKARLEILEDYIKTKLIP